MAPHHCTTPSAKVATTATLLSEARTAIALAIWGIRKIYINIKKKTHLSLEHPSSTSIYCQLPRSAPQSSALLFDNRTPRRWESPRLLPCHDCKIWRRFCNLFLCEILRNPIWGWSMCNRIWCIRPSAISQVHKVNSSTRLRCKTLETCTRHSDLGRPENWKKS